MTDENRKIRNEWIKQFQWLEVEKSQGDGDNLFYSHYIIQI